MTLSFVASHGVLAGPAPEAPAPEIPITTSASVAGLVMVLIFGFLMWRWIEKKKAKPAHMLVAFAAGVMLAGSLVGTITKQTTTAVGSGVQNMLGTVTNSAQLDTGSGGGKSGK
jgi:preprotein translocase subunit YajC